MDDKLDESDELDLDGEQETDLVGKQETCLDPGVADE
jgi:hypothetical protein